MDAKYISIQLEKELLTLSLGIGKTQCTVTLTLHKVTNQIINMKKRCASVFGFMSSKLLFIPRTQIL